ncbi:ABC transporter ATP-binding protein [Catellatospora citrea]|uniref:ABC transporter ATP-binding protein n=1 Tax=Catellatospora citrea TaxID=53366 RepID=UPI0033F38A2F
MAEAGGARVVLDQLCKTYRAGDAEITAVGGVSVEFEPGSVVAVTGSSGSGKSTMLHLVAGFDSADSGTVTVDDVEVTGLSPKSLAGYRRTIGFVFQRFHLLPALTALDNVIAPLLPYKVDFDRRDRARELLAAVGLAGREASMPGQLSGGQQQRVAIARALISRPRLFMADEPTGALDSQTGQEIVELLMRVNAEHGMTMLIATHEQRLAQRCGRRLHLVDGRIVSDDRVGGELAAR